MDNRNLKELKRFYQSQIEEDFFPFWERAYDYEFGGVYSCFNNESTKLMSKDKYTWSQGRFLWLVSYLYRMTKEGKLNLDTKVLKEMGEKSYAFLRDNVFLQNGNSAYALTREGEPIDFDGVKDTSIFSDTFVLIGFNAYGRFFDDGDALINANKVLNNIISRVESGDYLTEPYPVDKAFSSHSISMILTNCITECMESSEQTGFGFDLDLRELLITRIDKILGEHLGDDNLITEMMTDREDYKDTLLYNHINPGHTIECLWFLIHGLDLLGKTQENIKTIKTIFNATYEKGWDKEYGGLLRYVDRNTGQKPQGRLLNDRFEDLIGDTWDTKIWWPHSELLYTSLLIYMRTGDSEILAKYYEGQDYIFKTFPNPDKSIGEWIQIRDRQGNPMNKVVALPVKDPFHIIRNFIQIIDLLEKHGY